MIPKTHLILGNKSNEENRFSMEPIIYLSIAICDSEYLTLILLNFIPFYYLHHFIIYIHERSEGLTTRNTGSIIWSNIMLEFSATYC